MSTQAGLPTYSTETKERAYRDWCTSASLRKTAASLGIPEGTVISWSRSEGWGDRKIADLSKDRAVIQAHGVALVLAHQDALITRMVDLAMSDDREAVPAKVQLDAIRYLLGVIDIQPVQRKAIDIQAPTMSALPTTTIRQLSPDEQRQTGERLAAALASSSDP